VGGELVRVESDLFSKEKKEKKNRLAPWAILTELTEEWGVKIEGD